MESIIGASSMQKIKALELKSLPSGTELTDEEET